MSTQQSNANLRWTKNFVSVSFWSGCNFRWNPDCQVLNSTLKVQNQLLIQFQNEGTELVIDCLEVFVHTYATIKLHYIMRNILKFNRFRLLQKHIHTNLYLRTDGLFMWLIMILRTNTWKNVFIRLLIILCANTWECVFMWLLIIYVQIH